MLLEVGLFQNRSQCVISEVAGLHVICLNSVACPSVLLSCHTAVLHFQLLQLVTFEITRTLGCNTGSLTDDVHSSSDNYFCHCQVLLRWQESETVYCSFTYYGSLQSCFGVCMLLAVIIAYLSFLQGLIYYFSCSLFCITYNPLY